MVGSESFKTLRMCNIHNLSIGILNIAWGRFHQFQLGCKISGIKNIIDIINVWDWKYLRIAHSQMVKEKRYELTLNIDHESFFFLFLVLNNSQCKKLLKINTHPHFTRNRLFTNSLELICFSTQFDTLRTPFFPPFSPLSKKYDKDTFFSFFCLLRASVPKFSNSFLPKISK